MTAQLSWHVQNYDLISSSGTIFEQNVFLQDLDYKLINFCEMSPWTNMAVDGRQHIQFHLANIHNLIMILLKLIIWV